MESSVHVLTATAFWCMHSFHEEKLVYLWIWNIFSVVEVEILCFYFDPKAPSPDTIKKAAGWSSD